MADVYFSPRVDEDTIKKGLEPFIPLFNGRTVIKTHFGEDGNTRYVKAKFIKPIVDLLLKNGCDTSISDANTLYKGRRVKGSEHKQLAIEHGFGDLRIPIVIGDGEDGNEEYRVTIDGKHFHEAWIGEAYKDCETVILVNHFKGHIMAGFGGAIKNAGMGMASRKGKMAMHASVNPTVRQDACTACGACKKVCDHDAIEIDGKASIDPQACVGCAMCISACPTGAIDVPWGASTCEQLMERTAEYATAALQGKKVICINFAIDITKHCDCRPDSEIIADDVGVFFSTDPVAIDNACFEKLKEKIGTDVFKKETNVEGLVMIKHAEEVGLGSVDYSLKNI